MSHALVARLIEQGEEERRRLARELHDDISQRLALLADDADRLRREVTWTNVASRLRIDGLVDNARSLSEDLRRISHTLHPSNVEDLGLSTALRSLTSEFEQRTGLATSFDVDIADRELPRETSTALYRIVQEALRNITKHAGETSVRVTLENKRGEVVLRVSDNGKGFNLPSEGGLGLISMRERAHLAGGEFNISSGVGQGTTIQVRLPVPGHLCQTA